MQVIVTGGRDFDDAEMVARNLEAQNPSLVIEGGATGADRLAREWANSKNIPCITVEADWRKHGHSAGPKRNAKMIESFPEAILLAFPGGRGTSNCIGQAQLRGMKVVRAK